MRRAWPPQATAAPGTTVEPRAFSNIAPSTSACSEQKDVAPARGSTPCLGASSRGFSAALWSPRHGRRQYSAFSLLAAERVGPEEAHVEEDQRPSDEGEQERRAAGDADGEEAEPDVCAKAEAPDERREAGAEGWKARREGHATNLSRTKKIRRAGGAFVRFTDRLFPCGYNCPVKLQPTRAPCSAQLAP